MTDTRPVGILDSGFGGLSVARAVAELLPQENLVYAADCGFAPWGDRTDDFILERTHALVSHLLRKDVKAIVIACNTATSAAANTLRAEFPDVPIIGTEPALKPAVERHPGGRILVMATAMTVKEQKFQALRAQYEQQAEIIPIPCSGLMEFVEQGILRGEQLSAYLFEKLSPYLKVPVDAVVLGCTHYSFLQGAIRRIVGRTPEIIDGSYGIAMQLRRRLEAADGLNESGVRGTVTFENSLDEPEILALSRALLDYEEEK